MNLDARLEAALGSPLRAQAAVSGGNTAQASMVELLDGRRVFVKTGGQGFLQEANGLRELAAAEAIRIPAVLHAAADLLVLECIDAGPGRPDFMEQFGRGLAQLHRCQALAHGFYEDNFIGATPQHNTSRSENWAEFYWTHRLRVQLRLAEQGGRADGELHAAMSGVELRLPDLLAGTEEPPCLLHGDLWNGNFLVGPEGAPVLIDPAVYYGHREADLGMTHLFGGFSPPFYAAYQEAWPLPDGHRDRIGLYKLYHVLNHLNLFGRSYLGQAIQLARQYA